jgi:hypothetical protein
MRCIESDAEFDNVKGLSFYKRNVESPNSSEGACSCHHVSSKAPAGVWDSQFLNSYHGVLACEGWCLLLCGDSMVLGFQAFSSNVLGPCILPRLFRLEEVVSVVDGKVCSCAIVAWRKSGDCGTSRSRHHPQSRHFWNHFCVKTRSGRTTTLLLLARRLIID